MRRIKQWGAGCLAACLFLALAACGGKAPLLKKAETAELFKALLSQQMTAYSDQWEVFSNQMESFYDTVQKGEKLDRLEPYKVLRDAWQTWCEGLETYAEEGVFEAYRPAYEKMQKLAAVTRSFLEDMKTVTSVSEMESVVDAFVQEASPMLSELAEEMKQGEAAAEDTDWIVGKWSIQEEETECIDAYQADGTVTFSDGSQGMWRRKNADETEDASIWNTKGDEADAQVYYISSNGSDLCKEVVKQGENGTLQVEKTVIYSKETTIFTYAPVQ